MIGFIYRARVWIGCIRIAHSVDEVTVPKAIRSFQLLRIVLFVGVLPIASCGSSNTNRVQSAIKEWTWVSGSYIADYTGRYGTQGQPSSANLPGSRSGSVRWTDASGNLWLFGGFGVDANGNQNLLNDLWKFNPSTQQWTWVSGSNVNGEAGVYGIEGNASATNTPGAREGAVGWTDTSGNFWLFGGNGVDANGTPTDLNDLWEFNPGNNEWTWMSGSKTENYSGNTGTPGTTSTANLPGAREGAVGWTDTSGNFWLFGGLSQTASGYQSMMNDVWEFHPSNHEWTWVSDSLNFSPGEYGTKGVPSANNTPGSRENAVGWTDNNGNFWLFGGFQIAYSYGSFVQENMNDLWKFNPDTQEWTWVSGSKTGNAPGVYGTEGVEAAANVPGARASATGWTDASGNLLLFGGNAQISNSSYLGDLWKFDMETLQWVWMSGTSSINAMGQYGTQNQPSATNIPTSRAAAVSWTGSNGHLWLFGGIGAPSSLSHGQELNDLWAYQP